MSMPRRAVETAQASQTWRSLRAFFGERKWPIAALIAASVGAGLCESAILAIIAQVAAALVAGRSTVSAALGPIHLATSVASLLLIGLIAALARLAMQGLLAFLPALISAEAQAGLRLRLFAAFTTASWSTQSAEREGQFQELATSQVIQATQGVLQATTALTSLCTLAILVAFSLVVGLVPALVVLGAAFSLFLVLRPLNAVGRRHARALSSAQVDYATGIHDAVALAEETKVFGTAHAQQRHMARLVDLAKRQFFLTQLLSRLVPGAYQAAVLLLLLAGLGVLALTGATHLASLGAVILLLVRASSYGQRLQGSLQMMHQQVPFLDRLRNAQYRYRSALAVHGDWALTSTPSLSFNDVSFSYVRGLAVLDHLTFDVEAGEAIGLVGPTGAGKSTLVQLLLGLRAPGYGRYLLDGNLATTMSRASWTRAFAYVSQEPRLFHGSIADNIRFFRPIEDAAIEHAARLAHIHDEIAALPAGYNTVIGQRADAVSGGQRQRICLARALVTNPLVLVLDEPTSNLDPYSESLVQATLAALKGQMTIFIVAHRFSTLRLCDRVMVLIEGRLQDFGTPDELARTNAYYRNAANLSGLSPAELHPLPPTELADESFQA